MFVSYLYHITRAENINSILEFGLGAVAGNGINMEQAVSNKVYTLDFDPIPFIQKTCEINDLIDAEKNYIVNLIIDLLMYRSMIVEIAVIKINTQMLDKHKLVKDNHPNEKFVYIYYGIIPSVAFTYNLFLAHKSKNYFF